jgi:FkbM family methyltransferase
MLRVYHRPIDAYGRYLLRRGAYPERIALRTPIGDIELSLYSHDDILTVNEIFCRQDYPATEEDRVFVDFGSNIGVSAAYFLTRGSAGFAYLYEPVPRNVARLRDNLAFLEGRFALEETAVGSGAGVVRFGIEKTGRYGGIGVQTGQAIEVCCLDSNDVLRTIIARHGRIDVLKVDIEGLEGEVVRRIPTELRPKIHRIYAEWTFSDNPMVGTHRHRQTGPIASFRPVAVR